MSWQEDQEWEAQWWASHSFNTFGEEAKQITYAHRMGLVNTPRDGKWPVYDLGGRSVLDVGGGPVSLLLKCVNVRGTVLDPCAYPDWVAARYAEAAIEYIREPGEGYFPEPLEHPSNFDECWLYNVIQHCEDPASVLRTCWNAAPLIRVFEWVDTFPAPGHPNIITAALIRGVLGPGGLVEEVNENGAVGRALAGVFNRGLIGPS